MIEYIETESGHYELNGSFIPNAPGNSDYERLLSLVAGGQAFITPYAGSQTALDNKANAERIWRDLELQTSDFTQLPDSPGDKQAWATYRQALRDYPASQDFPNGVRPTRP